MKRLCILLVQLMALTFTFAQMTSADPTNRYVVKDNPGALPPYDAWSNAAAAIQTAIDYAYTNETVWVSNGVYETLGVTNYPAGTTLTNRIAIYKAITVRAFSANPADTFIKGAGPNGLAAVRCVYMTNGSALLGFTLTNGATLLSVDNNGNGGGVYCQSNNTVISNCVLTGNSARAQGGGAYYGTLFNCALTRNSSAGTGGYGGGGASGSTLYNCTLTGNSGNSGDSIGGGAQFCTLFNCTIVGNSANAGGGARGGTLFNCTLTGNSGNYGGGVYGATLRNCISWGNNKVDNTPTAYNSCGVGYSSVSGNITNDPMFITNGSGYGTGHVAGNYRLRNNSPGLKAGTNSPWMSDPADARSKDLDGHPRIDGATRQVDMGAYEYPFNITIISFH